MHIVGQPPIERVRWVGWTITDQQKRRPFATLGQVSRGAVAAPAALSRLGARKKASHDVPSKKWPVRRKKHTGPVFSLALLGEEMNQATVGVWEKLRRLSGVFR
jgi:hypothetical protein